MASTTPQLTPDEFVDALSFDVRLPSLLCFGSAQLSTISRDASSSASRLDRLPLEIVHNILGQLDVQSITRFIRTSLRSKQAAETLTAYHNLVSHAPKALVALGRTDTARLHTVDRLYAALRSDSCVSCTEFGIYLFLPTCERCCHECLEQNQSLWLTTKSMAQKAFSLTAKQIKQIPDLHVSVGSEYDSSGRKPRARRRLVSVQQAKRLGLKTHGSVQKMKSALLPVSSTDPNNHRRAARLSPYERDYCNLFLNAPLDAPPRNPYSLPSQGRLPEDPNTELGAVLFPFLRADGQIEHGLFCRGCSHTMGEYLGSRLSDSDIEAVFPEWARSRYALPFLVRRVRWARLRDQFSEHIKHCIGAPGVLEERRRREETRRRYEI